MYTPSHFKQDDPAAVREMMARLGFAALVTNTATGMVATHVPVLLGPGESEHGILRGHVARANPQWKAALPGEEALAIFSGSNGYVSPRWYATKREHGRVVPTWNYIAIHAYGRIEFSEDRERLRSIVTRLTEHHEAQADEPWKVTDAPAEYVDGLLNAIIAFEMQLTRVEATWKLSQNRPEADRAGAMSGLRERGDAVAEAMESWYLPKTDV